MAARGEALADRLVRRRVTVRGAVQGVGFRPFLFREATALGLAGWAANSPDGLVLEIEGAEDGVETLLTRLRRDPPPHAVIAGLAIEEIAPRRERGFTIETSRLDSAPTAQILPDLATCAECLAELFDPGDRRHRYPFITCTHCGPRYTIIESGPYDRARTAMRHFPLCPACQAEYDDPAHRRFHAETNACPACGPRLSLTEGAAVSRDDEALGAAAQAVREGRIVAIKGIGGFHLIVDARNEAAVARLRTRKRRPDKPLAVMVPALDQARTLCRLSREDEALLTSTARPIVLARRAGDGIADAVAPGNPYLGIMLPYAPLHHLLMHDLGFPVVATSGNLSDEPIAIDNDEARDRLNGIADLFLVHDRPILRAVDDSIARIVAGRPLVLRRSRGMAPAPLPVRGVTAGIMAMGGHLKTSIAVTRDEAVVVGPHVGDVETVGARQQHARTCKDLTQQLAVEVRSVAHDLHPDYATTLAAKALGHPTTAVQHHLAHVLACMADNQAEGPVLGIAWDGTGYGTDGTIWGGEFLVVTQDGWRRAAHLRPFRLPGGDAAAREPRRAAMGLLHAAYGDEAWTMTDLPPLAAFAAAEREVLRTMLARGVNAPLCSSMGRLFDGFAALCGLRQRATYEGQAAAELEWAAESHEAEGHDAGRAYDLPPLDNGDDTPLQLDWTPALDAALADRRAGVSAGAISAGLHAGLTRSIVAVAQRVGLERVALTGGCFQNARLAEAAIAALRAAGFAPLWHRHVPPNDGGIALGQAVWAAWSERRGECPCA